MLYTVVGETAIKLTIITYGYTVYIRSL